MDGFGLMKPFFFSPQSRHGNKILGVSIDWDNFQGLPKGLTSKNHRNITLVLQYSMIICTYVRYTHIARPWGLVIGSHLKTRVYIIQYTQKRVSLS